MFRFSFNGDGRHVPAAYWLGALAFVTNSAFRFFLDPALCSPGDMLIYISALAFGLPSAMISSLISVIPEMLATRDIAVIRVLLLAATLGICSTRFPRIPGYLAALGAWILVIWPFLLLTDQASPLLLTSVSNANTNSILGNMAMCDIVLILVSGALLLNRDLWGVLTHRPRHLRMPELLLHIIPLITATVVLLALSISGAPLSLLNHDSLVGTPYGFLTLMLVCIALPAFVGLRLARVIGHNYQELMHTGIIGPSQTFSGLSSDFWRRQSSPEIKNPRVTTSSTTNPSSEGELALTTQSKLDAQNQGICALNRNGTVTFVNRKFKSLAELTSNEVIGKRITSLSMNGALRDQIIQLLEDTFSKGPRITELKVNELPAKLRFFEVSSVRSDAFQSSTLADGPDSVIITVKEITERRTVELHLLQGQKLDSLGTLMGGVTHAFNNALTAIAGESSFAQHLTERTAVDESLKRILQFTRSAAELVHKLAEFATSQPGLMRPENFGELLRNRLSLLRQVLGGSCEITLSLPSEPLGVNCDSNLIMQALTNLLLNSKESYPEESGKIELTLETEALDEDISFLHIGARPGRYARLKVHDLGAGMSTETLGHAFDPLFTTKKGRGHAGLGLSIVFAVVRAHNGFLTAQSQTGKGTTVSLYFPLQALPSSVDTEAGEGAYVDGEKLPKGNQEKILVIDDDAIICDIVSRMLSSLGYLPVTYTDVEEAVEKCAQEPYKVAIVDLMMPKMLGFEATRKIRECLPTTKLILMTGHGIPAETLPFKGEILAKPFELEVLARLVKKVLGASEQKS